MFWFTRKLFGKAKEKITTPSPMLTDVELEKALKVAKDVFWGIGHTLNDPWSFIPPVRVPVKFSGWGYVEGRTRAFVINARVAVCEADDDMDFTDHCVLLDGVPTLIIHKSGYNTSVTIVAKRSLLEDVMRSGSMSISSVEEFRKMPEPVQRIMNDVIVKIVEAHNKICKNQENGDAIEKLLTY